MSEFFSPLYDNGLDTRSNSLITNELFVKDPLTNEYKPIIPNEGGETREVPYYADESEINFGIGKTKIDETKIELESSIQRYSMLDGFRARYYNNGAETDYEAGYIRWKDSQDEPVKKSILLSDLKEVQDKILPIDYLKEDGIELLGSTVFNAIKPGGISVGSGTSPTSLTNRTTMTTLGFRVTGAPSTNYTNYGNGIITDKLGNELILADIINSQKNYLKPDKIEFDRAAVGLDSIITKAPTMYTKMTSSALITGAGTNTSSNANQTRLIWDGIRIYGTSGSLSTYKQNEIQYINDDDTKSFTIVDAEKVVNGLKTLNSTAAQIDAVVNLSYLKPDTIDFVKDSGDSSPAIWIQQYDNYNGLILAPQGMVAQNQVLGLNNMTTPELLQLSNYTLDDDVTITARNFTAKYAGSSAVTALNKDIVDVANKLKDLQSSATEIDAAVANSGGPTYDYLTNEGIRTTGTQSITHKINSGDSLNRYSLTSNRIHHQSSITVGNNPSSGQRTEIQQDRIYLREGSGEFSAFYNDHIRYVKGGEVKYLYYGDVNETIDKVNKGFIKPSFWSNRATSKIFWIGKYEKALETTYNFPSDNIIQFTEHAVRNSGKLLFRMRYESAYSTGAIIKFIFRVQKPTTTPEGPALVNKYAMITADICDVPRKPLAKQYLGALVEVVSVGPSLHVEDVEDHGGINFESEYFAYYTLQLRALKPIPVGELDFTMMFQFHGYLGDFGSMPTSMYVV